MSLRTIEFTVELVRSGVTNTDNADRVEFAYTAYIGDERCSGSGSAPKKAIDDALTCYLYDIASE